MVYTDILPTLSLSASTTIHLKRALFNSTERYVEICGVSRKNKKIIKQILKIYAWIFCKIGFYIYELIHVERVKNEKCIDRHFKSSSRIKKKNLGHLWQLWTWRLHCVRVIPFFYSSRACFVLVFCVCVSCCTWLRWSNAERHQKNIMGFMGSIHVEKREKNSGRKKKGGGCNDCNAYIHETDREARSLLFYAERLQLCHVRRLLQTWHSTSGNIIYLHSFDLKKTAFLLYLFIYLFYNFLFLYI